MSFTFEGFNIVGGDESGRASVSGLDVWTSLHLTTSSCACSRTLFRINDGRLRFFNEWDGIQRWSKTGGMSDISLLKVRLIVY